MDTEISSEAAVAIDIINQNKEKRLCNSNSKRSSNTNKKRVLDPHGEFILTCIRIFYFSSVISVSTDPLFLYIPIIKDHKCLGIDKKMVIVSLVLRSLTDLFYILHIVFRIVQVWDASDHHKTNKNESSPSWLKLILDIINDILAVLPLPQVIILRFLSKMTSSKHSWDRGNARLFLTIMVFLQYAPRAIRILILHNTLKWHIGNQVFNTWVQSILYIYLYSIASHVGGGFYHLLSIERETTCWYQACQKYKVGCNIHDLHVFECGPDHQHNMSNNDLPTFVNTFCYDYTNPAFDFGVFVTAIKSNILGSTDIPAKFIQTIWWGLRHLSTYGQSLDPTTGTLLEVGFVACVFIFGLLLFLLLIGTVQTFMQLESIKSVNVRLKMISKKKEVKEWVKKHFLLSKDETIIMQQMQSNLTKLRKDHLEVHEVVDSLPLEDKKHIKRQISYYTLRRVPLLRNKKDINDQVIEDFIQKSKLVSYKKNEYIVRKGEPLDLMFFFTQGIVWTYVRNFNISDLDGERDDSNNIIRIKNLYKGDFYGEELLEWTLKISAGILSVPISTTNVKTHTEVEALVLMHKDLRSIVKKHRDVFSKLKPTLEYKPHKLIEHFAASLIQRTFKRYLINSLYMH